MILGCFRDRSQKNIPLDHRHLHRCIASFRLLRDGDRAATVLDGYATVVISHKKEGSSITSSGTAMLSATFCWSNILSFFLGKKSCPVDEVMGGGPSQESLCFTLWVQGCSFEGPNLESLWSTVGTCWNNEDQTVLLSFRTPNETCVFSVF